MEGPGHSVRVVFMHTVALPPWGFHLFTLSPGINEGSGSLHSSPRRGLIIKNSANLLMKNGILCFSNFHLAMKRLHLNYPQIV